jgi:SAM-dependent methyltransferase
MHVSFLDYLADPQTGEALTLSAKKRQGDFVTEGSLHSSRNEYPIVRGIPRFAGYSGDRQYAKSFGYQWNKWSRVQFESENFNRPMQGHTLDMWERITSVKTDDLKGAVIADFGCGPGRFMDVVRMKKGKAIGVDLSDAVEAAQENFKDDPNVLVCQGDVLNSPLKPQSVDGAFSIGVFHHTPDPQKGFREMAEATKPGGWVSVCVYGKGGYYDFPTVAFYRGLFKLMWPVFKHYPPLVYSYMTAYGLRPFAPIPPLRKTLKVFFPHIQLPDPRWSLLDTFDSVTPSYQSAHESYEVFEWFKSAGLTGIEPSPWGFTAYHGRKPGADAALSAESRKGSLIEEPSA